MEGTRRLRHIPILANYGLLLHATSANGRSVQHPTYLICSCKQIVSHFVKVRCLPRVNEAHHFFKNLRFHIIDFNSILHQREEIIIILVDRKQIKPSLSRTQKYWLVQGGTFWQVPFKHLHKEYAEKRHPHSYHLLLPALEEDKKI